MSIRVLNRGKPIIGTGGGGSTVYADTALDLLCGTNSYIIPSAINDKNYGMNSPYIFAQNSFIQYIDTNNAKYCPQSFCNGTNNLYGINAPNLLVVSSYCFTNAYYISSISFPELTYICGSCFNALSSLTTVNFPKVVFIDQWAVANITYAQNIMFPELVFASSNNFNNMGNAGSYVVTSMNFNKLVYANGGFQNMKVSNNFIFELPKVIRGQGLGNCASVEEIREPFACVSTIYAYSCGKLKSIYAPLLTENINMSNCSMLESFVSPYINYVGQSAFYNCSALHFINQECLASIGSSAFYGCKTISYIKMGCNAGGSLGQNAFYNCSSMSSFYIFGITPPALNANTFNNTPMTNSTYLGYYGSIYIPNHPAAMSNYATATNWASISARLVLMDSSYNQEYIYGSEFQNTSIIDMASISGRENARVIYDAAFAGCSSLISVSFSNCEILSPSAFVNCQSLQNVYMPNCSFVGRYAFANDAQLESVDIGNVQIIGSNAFYNCSRLNSINMSNVKVIHSSAFVGCSSMLGKLELPNCIMVGSGAFRGTKISGIDISNCCYIFEYAFSNCSNLSSINIDNVEILGSNAFNSCPLTEINNQVKILFASCFGVCRSLTTVNLPSCVKMGGYNFYDCRSLSTISLPKLISMAGWEFANCYALQEISLPVCTFMHDAVFNSCSSLSKVYVPMCRNFGSTCFQTTAIKSFINACATSYGSSCFRYCQSLTSIYFLNTFVPYFGSYVLDNTPIHYSSYTGTFGSIYVRTSLLSLFQTAQNISKYSARMVGLTDEEIAQLDF